MKHYSKLMIIFLNLCELVFVFKKKTINFSLYVCVYRSYDLYFFFPMMFMYSTEKKNKYKLIEFVQLHAYPCIVDEFIINTDECEKSNIRFMISIFFFSSVHNVHHFLYNRYVIYLKLYNQ